MAKAKTAGKRTVPQPRKWPQSADLKPWLERYLDVCEQHPQAEESGIKADTSLKRLAECGFTTAALTRLQRLLDRLPADQYQATGFLAIAGAEICLNVPDVHRAEKYLELAQACQKKAPRREQKFIQNRLERLRQAYGLSESADVATYHDDPYVAQIGQVRQKYREALLAGDANGATKALLKIAKLIPEISFWEQKAFTLTTGSLRGMGLTELANRRAEKLVLKHLQILKRDTDPNIHFPVKDICDELWFFVQTGQKDTAAKLLKKALREMPHWPGLRGGFPSSGALTDFAEILAEVDSPAAAAKLLGLAVQTGQAERQPGFRASAVKAARQQINAPGLDGAIAKAQSIKSAKRRRDTLVQLFARHAAWSQLATLLNEITSTKELLESLNTVLHTIPGGSS